MKTVDRKNLQTTLQREVEIILEAMKKVTIMYDMEKYKSNGMVEGISYRDKLYSIYQGCERLTEIVPFSRVCRVRNVPKYYLFPIKQGYLRYEKKKDRWKVVFSNTQTNKMVEFNVFSETIYIQQKPFKKVYYSQMIQEQFNRMVVI